MRHDTGEHGRCLSRIALSTTTREHSEMTIIRMFVTILLWPGDAVRRRLGISVEQDGGLIRSFVNQVFWGTVLVVIAFRYFI